MLPLTSSEGVAWVRSGGKNGGGGDPRAQAASPTLGLVRWPWAVSCSLWALVFPEAGPSLAFFLRVLGRAGSCGSPCKWLLALGRFLWQTEGHLPPWLTQAEGHSKLGTQNPTRAGGGLVPPSISFPGCCLPLSLLPSHPLIQGCSLGSYALQTPPPAVRPHLFSPTLGLIFSQFSVSFSLTPFSPLKIRDIYSVSSHANSLGPP